jgi:hypothetical protein
MISLSFMLPKPFVIAVSVFPVSDAVQMGVGDCKLGGVGLFDDKSVSGIVVHLMDI